MNAVNWLQLIPAGLGTFAFSLCYRLGRRHLLASTIGGILGWAIYLLAYAWCGSLFLSNLCGAFGVHIWCEFSARRQKAPVTIFLLPGIVPMLPGGQLYYALRALIDKDIFGFEQHGISFVLITIGIACGVVAASILSSCFFNCIAGRKVKR